MEGETWYLVEGFRGLLETVIGDLRTFLFEGIAEGIGFSFDDYLADMRLDLPSDDSASSDDGSGDEGRQRNSSYDQEADDEEQQNIHQLNSAKTSGYSSYYGDVTIKKVPRYWLGYRVLGRAFPGLRLIEIASDLYGPEFEEVRTHELIHVRNPQLGESEVRRLVREILPFAPRFH